MQAGGVECRQGLCRGYIMRASRLSGLYRWGTALIVIAVTAGCASSPPAHFVTADGQFTPCASAPHCVSSQAPADSDHHVTPWTYTTGPSIARSALIATLSKADNAQLVTRDPQFLHATFTSTLGFVDDVTFLIHPDAQRIDVKSSSRIGYYDFGVNRNRVARLHKDFDAELAAKQPE